MRQEMKTSIGLKRTWEILKTKIEQRCKSSSNGPFGMTSPHVLARMFHEFDVDGGGALSRDEFERALKEKLGLMMISKKDLDALTDEFDQVRALRVFRSSLFLLTLTPPISTSLFLLHPHRTVTGKSATKSLSQR